MARIRSIKPDFFTSERIAELPLSARLTFIGLWTHADDNGVMLDNPRLIMAALWPLEEDPREALGRTQEDLRRLSEAGLIVRYEGSGKRLLYVRGWDEHQKVSHPGKPRYERPSSMPPKPAPVTDSQVEEWKASTEESSGEPPEDSGNAQESLLPEQGAGSREQGAGKGLAAEAAKRGARIPAEFGPTPDMVAWARAECSLVDIDYETKQFVGHWSSKTGKDATKLDWPTTWKNWLRKSQKDAADRAERERRRGSFQSQRSSGQNLHRDSMTPEQRAARDPMEAVLAAQNGGSR